MASKVEVSPGQELRNGANLLMEGKHSAQPKIFIISLPRALRRRSAIVEQCNRFGVDFEFIDAVDGRLIVHDGRGINPGGSVDEARLSSQEVACSLSHRVAYTRLVDQGQPGAIILEDDAILQSSFVDAIAYFRRNNAAVINENIVYQLEFLSRKGQAELFFIRRRTATTVSRALRFVEEIRGFSNSKPWGTAAYYITRQAALSSLGMPAGEVAADDWRAWEEATGGKLLFALPPAVIHPSDRSDSEIEPARRRRIAASMAETTTTFSLSYRVKVRLMLVLKWVVERVW